jgi:hypothetical protein
MKFPFNLLLFSPSEKKSLFWFLCYPVVAVLPNKHRALCIHESNKCLHFEVVSIAGNGKVGVPGGGGCVLGSL